MPKQFKRLSRKKRAIGIASAVVLLMSGALHADSEKINFQIEQQSAGKGLMKLAEQAGIQIAVPTELGNNVQLAALDGRYTVNAALDRILRGTGLVYEFVSDHSVIIRKESTVGTGREPAGDKLIEELIVTANKRAQSIQDVPLSISAFSSEDIEKKNLVDMDDYLTTLPGVNMIDMGAGRNSIFIRGVAADPQFEDRTVGVYFGEVPVSALSLENGAANLKMVDISRVEVLRGPQGTLYGSGSMGGTVRVIPNNPDLSDLGGSIEGMYSNTDKKGGNNGMLQGVINIPIIEDKFAVRAVAYQYENSGYVENVSSSAKAAAGLATGAVLLEQDEVGSDTTTGFRLSALWQATDDLSFTYGYATQEIDADGRHDVNLTLDDYQQARFSTPYGNEFLLDDIESHNLIVEYDLNWGSLLSSSSWLQHDGLTNRNFLGAFWEPLPVSQRIGTDNQSFVEEIRLASSLDGPVQFVVGFYYEDIKKSLFSNNNWGGDPALSESFGFGVNSTALGTFFIDQAIEQKAIFAEASYDLTEQLSLTVGGRFFEYDRESSTTSDGGSFFSQGFEPQFVNSNESGDSFKVNLTYSPDENKMFYAQWGEGFRLGQPLPPPPAYCDANNDGLHDDLGIPFPNQLNSDFLENFEVGSKLSLADNRLTINTSIYRIKWDGIPILVGVFSPCGSGLQLNAGSASSEGFEVESTFHATNNLRVDMGGSYVNAELGADVIGGGNKGDRLPGTPEYNFNVGVQYDFDLAGRTAYVRGDYAYVAGFYNNFQELGQQAGDYSQFNIKAGMDLNNVHLALFINNLLNEGALTWVDAFPPTAHQLRPRTVGFNVGYRF